MNSMSYKRYHATVGFDGEDEIFTGRIAGITDIIGFHADSVAGLKNAFYKAVDDYIETCEKLGKQPMQTRS